MISIRNNGDDNSNISKEKIKKEMVSGRIPFYVIEYAQKRKITISQLIMAGFDAYRENDIDHAFERLSYHENRVLHWKQKVIQHDSECNTKLAKCNTVKELFIKQGRGSPETKQWDMNWCEHYIVKDFINEGIPITTEELYKFCTIKELKTNANF